MAIAELYAASQAVDSTEWSCPNDAKYAAGSAITTDGVYQIFLDVSDMVATDILQIRVYEKCQSGGTQRIVYEAILRDAQGEPIWVSPSLILLHGWDVTLDALANSITVLWSIRQVA